MRSFQLALNEVRFLSLPPKGGEKGGGFKKKKNTLKVPSWQLEASALRLKAPAESYFAIYLHIIIAMRCRH